MARELGVGLIFLSWAYPPMNYPRAIQVARLAAHLDRRPLKIFCFGAEGDGTEANMNGVTVTRFAEPAAMRFLTRLTPQKLRVALLAPDPQRPWAMAAARRIAASQSIAPEDVLVTFGQPMSSHLAGLALKRRFGNRWIAHFSDPWADNPLAPPVPLLRARNLAAERQVVAAADQLLFTSAETVELVMAKYPPTARQKASVLPHAFDATLYPPQGMASGPFILRYLGTLYGKRGPQPLFQGLAAMAARAPDLVKRIRVELVGEVSPRLKDEPMPAMPPGLVRFVPAVGYRDSLALMRSADLLLQIDAPAEKNVFLASKLVEYAGARRPILGITPPGTAARLIHELGGWVADPASPDAIAAALIDAIGFLETARNTPWGKDEIRTRYDIATIAASFARILGSPLRTPLVAAS
jgi:glycosyltransferase involved in cell wall biosynthesis